MNATVMNKERLITLSLMVVAAAVSRLAPHPYNFTPVAAIALFSGAQFERRSLAFAVPLLALLLSDVVIGFYAQMWVVYAAFALIVCIGFALRGRAQFLPVAIGTLSGAILFFLMTNFAPLVGNQLYPQNLDGILQSYAAGIPFFRNTLLSDIFYSALLFGGFALAERRYSRLAITPLDFSARIPAAGA